MSEMGDQQNNIIDFSIEKSHKQNVETIFNY